MTWNSYGGIARGRSHEKSGTPCQDRYYINDTVNMSVAALSDGAGSAALSHYGAQAVAEKACALLSENFETFYNEEDGLKVKSSLLKALRERLEEITLKQGWDMKDLSCTLLFTAVKDGRFILGHVGDGVIGCLKNDDAITVSAPSNGEFANTTCFITSPNALEDFRLYKGSTDGISAFCLMTDGPEAGLYDKRTARLAPAIKNTMIQASNTMIPEFDLRLREGVAHLSQKVTFDDCGLVVCAVPKADPDVFNQATEYLQCRILGINPNKASSKRLLRQYKKLLSKLNEPLSTKEAANIIHVRESYTHNKIAKLCQSGLVVSKDGKFILREV